METINWLRYKKIYFSISFVLIVGGVISILLWGFKLGVDFKGGTLIEYRFEKNISTEKATNELERVGMQVSSVQKTVANTYLFRLSPITPEEKEKVATTLSNLDPNLEELRLETVGPSVGPELVKKTLYAALIAAGGILLWVAYQFKDIKYGASAILAMFHDTFILVGSFSILGHFFGAEVDFLFVTAVLTTLSFSVHDTIVVFDRIREIKRKFGGDLESLANVALTETMVRSLNNSFTIAFMLVALLLLGGTTVKWFAAALLIGTILGTYSSPFVAVPILVSWDGVIKRIKLLNPKKILVK